METPVIFLILSVVIIVLAIFLSYAFRKTRARDRANEDLNGNPADASGHATWIGIRRASDDDGAY